MHELQKDVLDKAETQSAVVLSEARQEAKEILAKAKLEASALAKQSEEKALAEASALKAEHLASARLEARSFESNARNKVVDEVFVELKNEFKDFASTKEYEKFFSKLVSNARKDLGQDGVILANKKDQAMAKKLGKTGEVLDSIGGVIIASSDGRIRVNSSFEALLEEKSESLKQAIFEELFSPKTTKSSKKKKELKK
ncbi:hypothetical protein HUU53_02550 [Candidatus Micrarchaeota archaeon]|nr:hypothetical protein [Candidatus Micrarchaeota archaeon]